MDETNIREQDTGPKIAKVEVINTMDNGNAVEVNNTVNPNITCNPI